MTKRPKPPQQSRSQRPKPLRETRSAQKPAARTRQRTDSRTDARKEEALDQPAPPHTRLRDDFFGDGGHLIAIERPGARGPGIMYQETGRTVVRNKCRITAFFGLAVWGRDRRKDAEVTKVRFAQAQPELWITTTGAIGIRISVAEVGTVPGTLTIAVTRAGGGVANPAVRTYAAQDLADLHRQIASSPEILLDPPATNGTNRRTVVETITASVGWKPDAGPGCSVAPAETLRLRWEHAGPTGRFDYGVSKIERVRRERSGVATGRTIVGRPEPDGSTRHGVPVYTYFAIARSGECCGEQRSHAVIQFVRHEWDLGENPRKRGSDPWSLDVLDSEITRAGAGDSYDPTFTHNPRGTAPAADPLVHEGPDDTGALSLVQEDHPGIPPALLNRFRQATSVPSTFTFHFLSLLVCQLDPSDAATYIGSGTVVQSIEYKLTFRFRGRDREPEIETALVAPGVLHFPCTRLTDVLAAEDRGNRRRGQGKLRDGFNRPRPHRVGI
jgi:hypothetical protein